MFQERTRVKFQYRELVLLEVYTPFIPVEGYEIIFPRAGNRTAHNVRHRRFEYVDGQLDHVVIFLTEGLYI